MAYNRDEILQKCIKAIEEHKCTTFDEMSLFVEPDRTTLYLWDFDKIDIIKDAIAKQKVIAKSRMKKNWQREDAAPALQIAAFKLMADDEEFNKLITNKSDVKADVNLPQMKVLQITSDGYTEQGNLENTQSL